MPSSYAADCAVKRQACRAGITKRISRHSLAIPIAVLVYRLPGPYATVNLGPLIFHHL